MDQAARASAETPPQSHTRKGQNAGAPNPEPEAASSATTGQKLAWGLGGFSENLSNNALVNLAYPIFGVALKMNPMLIGMALSISRILDAFIDPVMGNVTDNTKSRWGRRRPWIALGAAMMAVFFGLTWLVPVGLGEWGLFAWFCVGSVAFYIGFTVFIIPYSALGLELTDDYAERTRLQIYRLVPAFIAGMVTPWLYKLALNPIFKNATMPTEVAGVRVIGALTAVVIFACALAPALFCKEPAGHGGGENIGLLKAVKLTLTDRSYLMVVGSAFCVFVGLYFTFPLMTYIGIYHVCDGNKDLYASISGYAGTGSAVAQMVMMVVLGWAAKRFEKKQVLLSGLAVAVLGYASSYWLFTPQNPWLMVVPPVITNIGLSACWVVNGAFVADVCDQDQLRSGQRREGMYSAVFGFVYKSAIGIVALLSSGLLAWAGIDSTNETVAPAMLDRVRVSYAMLPVFFLGAAIVLMWRYPLSRAKVEAIQAELAARKLLAKKAPADVLASGA